MCVRVCSSVRGGEARRDSKAGVAEAAVSVAVSEKTPDAQRDKAGEASAASQPAPQSEAATPAVSQAPSKAPSQAPSKAQGPGGEASPASSAPASKRGSMAGPVSARRPSGLDAVPEAGVESIAAPVTAAPSVAPSAHSKAPSRKGSVDEAPAKSESVPAKSESPAAVKSEAASGASVPVTLQDPPKSEAPVVDPSKSSETPAVDPAKSEARTSSHARKPSGDVVPPAVGTRPEIADAVKPETPTVGTGSAKRASVTGVPAVAPQTPGMYVCVCVWNGQEEG